MRSLLPALLLVGLSGCVMFSTPPDNAPFAAIQNIGDLEGTYRNAGEVAKNGPSTFLSAVIWPGSGIPHQNISEVEVRVLDGATIEVTGQNESGVVKQALFIEGQDFEIADGRIRIRTGGGIAGFKSGEPMVGPYYEKAELGLDAHGQGKYMQRGGAVGLVYLFLPVAFIGGDEVRFVRINKP